MALRSHRPGSPIYYPTPFLDQLIRSGVTPYRGFSPLGHFRAQVLPGPGATNGRPTNPLELGLQNSWGFSPPGYPVPEPYGSNSRVVRLTIRPPDSVSQETWVREQTQTEAFHLPGAFFIVRTLGRLIPSLSTSGDSSPHLRPLFRLERANRI